MRCHKDGEFVEFYSDGHKYASYVLDGTTLWLASKGYTAKYTLVEGVSDAAGKEALAPMTGKVVAVPVKVGQNVKEGDTLAILEAMKMEYRLEAEADGEVAEIGAEVGELVDLGHVLVRLK
ncbi:MAG: acetyl-CoA carboxylase biotin carboxyl carrier protein subunit [Fimbriimonadales bacterium]